ncbi:hypothetical protein RJ639_022792 [Escallonia herrerae]|uniref:NB-ARC domain-containing protein n=1 Tax=Escallonia herrerae TaxID=1293975 RepID=A0AA89ADB6_9ASTE|nr:hypothetical protein RJ639_022792 [Escallonia herrerae]
MELSTVKEGIAKVLNLLRAHHAETVVLVGEPGIGKTWTAREVSYQAIDEGLFDITLWAYLNGKCDTAQLSECKSLLESIAHQLYLVPTLEECEVEYDNVEAEIGSYLWEKISEILAEKRLLLIVEIYGPSNMVEEEIVAAFRTLLKLNQQSYKVLITRISRNALLGSSRVSELEPLSGEDSVIELKPLSVQEASCLLREKAGADAYNVPGVNALAENFIIKTKRLPVTITMMAKALRYYSASESAVRMLKRTLEGAPENQSYSIKLLLHSGYDMLPNSILMDLCWHGSHYFRDFRSVYFNELIAYWVVEGFLGRVNCIEQAYNDGHRVLMELIDCGVVKKLDEGYVFIDRDDLNLDEFRCHIKQEENCIYLDECYRGGSYGTNSLGLATVFDDKWEGFGKITQTNGMMKTICSSKRGHKLSTLLIDENNICWEVLVKLLTSEQELQVLGLFNWKLKSLSAILSNCANLQVLLLRSCTLIENINQTLNLDKLVVLEISGTSSLKEIPDVFGNMPNLQSINFSELSIDKLPSSFYKLSELVWLILRGCSCFKEMESLANMKKLIMLDLSRSTSFKTFKDPTFQKNPELRMLNLSETLISSVPIMFKKIRNLTHLLLSGCRHLRMLCKVTSLTRLQVLDLSGASIFHKFNDKSLASNTSLDILDLSGTEINCLPSNISNPRHLYLKNCSKLTKLPFKEGLVRLEVLDVSGTFSLVEIEEEFFEHLKHLQILNLSETGIRKLPSLLNLSGLRKLLLSCCLSLEEVPDLNSLTKLEVVDLSGCSALNGVQE